MAGGRTRAQLLALALAVLASVPAAAVGPATPSDAGRGAERSSTPIADSVFFVENRGQFRSDEVRFVVTAGGLQTGFADRAVLLHLRTGTTGVLVRATFLGATGGPPAGRDAADHPTNFFLGRDPAGWRTGVPSYRQVAYEDLYPGIDLVYRVAGADVKYEFRVRPGADLAAIRIEYEGVEGVEFAANGDLVLRTAAGEVRDTRPVGSQGGEPIPCAFRRIGTRTVGFACEAWDPARTLVIDPLVYATYLGGTGNDFSRVVAVDAAGSAYVAGATGSLDFPTTPGAYDRTYNLGQYDVFVAKISPAGNALVYSTFLGGMSEEDLAAIVVDGAGNAFVGGQTFSSDFPTTPGAWDVAFDGSSEGFLVKLNGTGGTLVYATFLGGGGDETVQSIALDAAGNAYVTGPTSSPDFPTTPGAFQRTYGGFFSDAYVAAVSSTGDTLLFASFLGGAGYEAPSGIARDASGALYVAGGTGSPDFPTTPGAFDTTLGGGGDAFVTKLNENASALLYSTFLGGAGDAEFATAIALHGTEVLVGGSTDGTDFPTTPGAYDGTFGGGSDSFVSKVNATGTGLLYSTYLGGSGEDLLLGLAVDSAGRAYGTGQTASADFPTTTGATDRTYNGGAYDAFAVKLSATGTELSYSTFLGGSRSDAGNAIALDGAGAAYVAGDTNSTDFPATAGAYDTTFNGGTCGLNPCWDAFAAKLTLMIPVTVDTSPTGLTVEVDLSPRTTPFTFDCEPGATATLNAPSPQELAGTRYAFASWSDGGAQSHAISCAVPETYVAAYVRTDDLVTIRTIPVDLSVDLDGTVVGTPYGFWCPAGSTHTVTALSPQGGPGTRYVFASWSDGGAQSHSFTCTGPRDLTATYREQHLVTFDASPAGRQLLVDGSPVFTPQSYWYDFGVVVAVEAPTPQTVGMTRYVFASWSDGGARAHSVTVTGPLVLVATFSTENQLTIDTSPANLEVLVNGAPATAPHATWCPSGDALPVDVPTPQGAGPVRFAFDSWSDGGPKAHAIPCSAPGTYVATFRTEYETRVDTAPTGLRVEVDGVPYTAPHTFWCAEGTGHAVAIPSPQVVGSTRYAFAAWSDGGAQNHTVGCTQPVSYTAVFLVEYLVTIDTSPAGLQVLVDGVPVTAPQAFWWASGSSHTLDVPTPQGGGDTRFAFSFWSDGGPRNHDVVATGPLAVTANFVAEYRVVVDSAPPGREIRVDGILYTLPQTFWWPSGSTRNVFVPATQAGAPGERFVWDSWSDGAPKDRSISVTGPLTLTVAFRHQYLLTVVSEHGSPYCDVPDCWYDADTDAILSVGATTVPGAEGVRYRFRAWTGDEPSPGLLVLVPMDRPKTMTATWTTEYLLRVISIYGNATGEGWYAANTTATFSVIETEVTVGGARYRFTRWTGAVNSADASGSIRMDGPKTVIANWEEVRLTDSLVVWLLPIAAALVGFLLFLWFWRRRRKPEGSPAPAREAANPPRTLRKVKAKPSPKLEDEVDLDARPKG